MSRRSSAGLIAAMLGIVPDAAPEARRPPRPRRRTRRRRSHGAMRKATRHPWGETERARRARQIERGQLRADNGLVTP